ncbi:hypothetical protein L6452_33140 [Arctium lappa]|uniref:Uncharacterized protein n=1 Tax=Arctium lappa TaxID=4217 RepID=A0ACB8Z6G6_ARCLA|nr:hypothetical protein L6452_33140 [Arctium lappa]
MSVDSGNPFAGFVSNPNLNVYQKGAFKLSGSGIRIEKWNGEGDFGKWQFTTTTTLRKNDVHLVVFAPNEKDLDMSTLEAKEMEAWAFTTLLMAMGPYVISEKTAAGIWKRLENLYLKKTLTNQLLLMRSCLFFKKKECTTIQAHMTEFEDIIMKLKATDSIFATNN